jgi:anti-repressor protein
VVVRVQGGGAARDLYLLTLSTAKEIAMVENNDKGREIRQYLIKVERAWNTPEMVMARALQMAAKTIENKDALIAELKPKAETLDKITASESDISVRELAAIIARPHLGQKNLFERLRKDGFIDALNRPYRQYYRKWDHV